MCGQLRRQRALVESFDCVLHIIVHGDMPYATAAMPPRRQLLQKVVNFLRAECSSEEFYDIIVLTLRKTDDARCGPLFDVLGPWTRHWSAVTIAPLTVRRTRTAEPATTRCLPQTMLAPT